MNGRRRRVGCLGDNWFGRRAKGEGGGRERTQIDIKHHRRDKGKEKKTFLKLKKTLAKLKKMTKIRLKRSVLIWETFFGLLQVRTHLTRGLQSHLSVRVNDSFVTLLRVAEECQFEFASCLSLSLSLLPLLFFFNLTPFT